MALFSRAKRRLGNVAMPPLPRRAVRAGAIVCLGMALSACAGGPDVGHEAGLYPVPTYTGGERFVWCVPYARQISGISIRGDADTWWGQASGRYARGNRPAPYAVLALKPTRRLSDGHIGVVTGLVGPREIRVSHANWGWTGATRGRVYTHMPVIDVSSGNDWTAVRFKHPAVGAYGRVYPALGFIYSPKDPNVRIARASPPRPRPAAPARVVARPVRAASPPAAPAPVAVPHTNATLRLF